MEDRIPDTRQAQAEVRYLIDLAGVTFRDIDRAYGLYRCAANNALRFPDEQAEKAILETLRVKLATEYPEISGHQLWPRRYLQNGKRRSKEALRNEYRKLVPSRLRQKEWEQRT